MLFIPTWIASSLALTLTVFILPGAHMTSIFGLLWLGLLFGYVYTTTPSVLSYFDLPLTSANLAAGNVMVGYILVFFTYVWASGIYISSIMTALALVTVLSLVNVWLNLHRARVRTLQIIVVDEFRKLSLSTVATAMLIIVWTSAILPKLRIFSKMP